MYMKKLVPAAQRQQQHVFDCLRADCTSELGFHFVGDEASAAGIDASWSVWALAFAICLQFQMKQSQSLTYFVDLSIWYAHRHC